MKQIKNWQGKTKRKNAFEDAHEKLGKIKFLNSRRVINRPVQALFKSEREIEFDVFLKMNLLGKLQIEPKRCLLNPVLST